MRPQSFNDLLALVLTIGILSMLMVMAIMYEDLRAGIAGALPSILILVVQFYYRKSQGGS